MGFTDMTTAGLIGLYNNMVVTRYNIDSILRPGDFFIQVSGQ